MISLFIYLNATHNYPTQVCSTKFLAVFRPGSVLTTNPMLLNFIGNTGYELRSAVSQAVVGAVWVEKLGKAGFNPRPEATMATDATNKVELKTFRLCLPEGWFFLDTNFL